ncbi:MAG: FG-GAP-like repeat-containing protein [Candidatus Eisenbacteria bacterium]
MVPSDGAGGFLPGTEYPGGEDCIAIDAVDTSGDSGPEIFVLSRNSLELSVYPTENGEVSVPPAYPLGSFDHWMDAGDVDGDGDLEIATAYGYAGSGGVRILRNVGNGTFLPAESYPSEAAMAVKLRDLDGNGTLDLLWADHPTAPDYDFVVRLNQGEGTFGPATVWTVGTCGNGDVDAFDMDGDGDLDVFLTDYLGCAGGVPSNYVWIRRNNGNGTFQAPYHYETLTGPEIVRGGDIDEDGNMDLLFSESNWIGLALGDGAGGFGPYVLHEVDWGPKHFVVDDLDGDGHLDVISANMTTEQQSVCVLYGNGDGTFAPWISMPAAYSPQLQGVHTVRVGDVDGDGAKDILALNGPSGDVGYYRNLHDRTFDRHVRYGVGPVSTDFVYGDFTGDGEADLAAIIGVPPFNLGRDVSVVAGLALDPASTPDFAADVRSTTLFLDAPRPNPFHSRTDLHFRLDRAEIARLTVHDASGRLVTTLRDEAIPAGEHIVVWDGRDDHGRDVPTGAYWARLQVGDAKDAQRILRVR